MGQFDGKELNTGVMIRFIEQQDEQLIFKSGGGITIFSEEEMEYQELIQKVYLPF
jgi:para-aminobenzoate synthetase component 1